MRPRLKLILALSILPQILIVKLLGAFPEFIERYYSTGLYVYISKLFRFLLGWIPFSIGDILYTLAIFYAIRWLLKKRWMIIRRPHHWLIEIMAPISIFYAAFHLLWAFNYYRPPLHKTLALKSDYTNEELLNLTQRLIDKCNQLQFEITHNDTLKVELPYTESEILKNVDLGYDVLSTEFPHLKYHPRSVKKSIYSIPLTYMGFSGYLNPFTNEAHIDGIIPTYKYPTTASHEIAHQLGYAAENEANFIGSLAAIHHPDIYYKYSGYTFALSHCLNEIYIRDFLMYEALKESINTGILKNYQEMYEFWMAYQNPIEPLFKSSYNRYLKANNQSLGMDSYNYVVALLVNYFAVENLE